MVYAALLGHGVVGSGVAEIMTEKKSNLREKANQDIELKYILDLRKFENLPYSDKFVDDFNVILNDDTIKIVVEVIGGLHPAFDFVKACLEKGKSVVTSNKELVAEKGFELINIAKQNNANFLFEASVGGAIPIIRPLTQCLAANKILDIYGILNGTTNYILNKMIVDSMDFDTALKLAQENGFAEKNPASDIEGTDACRKICILAALAYGKHVYPSQVKTTGITDITLDDVDNADKFNCVIKLIARAHKEAGGKISVSVSPMLIDKNSIISNVDGVFNAVMVKGDSCGDMMFYGRGAGKMPTASAVVADVIDCAKHIDARKYLSWENAEDDYVIETKDDVRFYVSAKADDFEGLKASFKEVFKNNTWYIINDYRNEIAFITEAGQTQDLLNKIHNLKYDTVKIMNKMI